MDRPASEKETELALQLLVALARSTHSVMKYCVNDILRYDLKVSEFEVLEMLYHKGPATQGAIAERVLLTMGSITYVVDQLQKKGLVRRVPCPEDRRIIHAEITDAGKAKMDAMFPPHALEVRRAMSGLSLEEQEQAIGLLKKLGMAASRLEPEVEDATAPVKKTRAPVRNKVNLI